MNKAFALFLLLVALTASAAAQKNEIGVLVGGHFPVNTSTGLSVGHAFMIQGNFAHRIAGVPLVSAYVEVPVIGGFNVNISGLSLGTLQKYSSLFITPGLKLKIAPSFPVSPYLAAGVGLARYKSTTPGVSTTNTVNKTAVDIGGGLDFKIAPFVSFRAEVRDVYSGTPSLAPLSLAEVALGSHQHNVLAGAGLLLRF